MDATKKKESVTGAVQMVGAVGKVGLEMDVMELLGEVMVINANLIQVLMYNVCICRGCQRCNFVLQVALNYLKLEWQLVEHVG